MLSPDAILQRRFEHKRPGLQLFAIEDAALPVTIVGMDVLTQERKPLPLLHEFVLRLINAGISDTADLTGYLGLDSGMAESVIAEAVSADNLSYSAQSSRVSLTSRGKKAVRELESIEPAHFSMSLVFDRLVWGLAKHGKEQLLKKREATDRGLILIPPKKKARISLSEVSAVEINTLLKQREGKQLQREVLTVRNIRPYTHRFLPVKLLVYGDPDRAEVELGFVVDGDGSAEHDRAFTSLGGSKLLGIKVEDAGDRPRLPQKLEDQRVPGKDITPLRLAAIEGRVSASKREAIAIAERNPTSNEEIALDQIQVRSVSVFEHRELLVEALETARRRILLISPWVKSAVVDELFLQRLERRLKSGVDVTIAHGIGKTDRGSDQEALSALQALARSFKDKFKFVRLASSHAKVLIFDDRWISTSFNWLSFRGDPERTYRMEEGTLVQIPGEVTAQYERYLRLIDDQRAG